MTQLLIAPDWAEFQPFITRQFGRRLLILRVAFGDGYQDPKFLPNAAVIDWLYRHGHIDGVILYQVWLRTATPAQHFAFGKQLIGPTPPEWLIGVEIDLETWRGTSYEQHGDHSQDINRLWALWCHYFGSWTAAGLYGNQGDLAELAPHRDPRAWVNIASYGPKLIIRRIKGAIAQQYTDGQAKWGVPTVAGRQLPRMTAGVQSDHNVFDPKRFPTAKALRAYMRPAAAKHRVTPPAAPRQRYQPGDSVVVSPDRAWELAIANNGHLELRHSGQLVRTL